MKVDISRCLGQSVTTNAVRKNAFRQILSVSVVLWIRHGNSSKCRTVQQDCHISGRTRQFGRRCPCAGLCFWTDPEQMSSGVQFHFYPLLSQTKTSELPILPVAKACKYYKALCFPPSTFHPNPSNPKSLFHWDPASWFSFCNSYSDTSLDLLALCSLYPVIFFESRNGVYMLKKIRRCMSNLTAAW